MPVKIDETQVVTPSSKSNVVLLRNSEEKIPPNNVKAEEAIVGGILLDPKAIEQVVDLLEPQHFYFTKFGFIYKACLDLYADSVPINLFSVTDKGSQAFSEDFTKEDLAIILENTLSSANIDQYASLVYQKWQRRQLIQILQSGIALAHDAGTQIDQVFETIESQLCDLSQAKDKVQTRHAGDVVWDRVEQIEQFMTAGKEMGMKCGYYDLDSYTQGFRPGQLVLIAGRPSMGKTQFALNVMMRLAFAHPSKKFLFVSLEMASEEIADRMIAPESQIELTRLSSAAIEDSEWQTFVKVCDRFHQTGLHICDNAYTLEAIRSQVRRLAMSGEIGGIAIDYLDYLVHDERNMIAEISSVTKGLKRLGKEMGFPVLLLSQLNRGVESRTNKRPMLSDLRNSGSLEQDADLAAFIYRDDYYNPETTSPNIAEIIVAKNRGGPTGTIELIFDRPRQRFLNKA